MCRPFYASRKLLLEGNAAAPSLSYVSNDGGCFCDGTSCVQNGTKVRTSSLIVRIVSYMLADMQSPVQSKPTASELEILRVLWERGPCTVREVYGVLHERKPVGYTTVLKLLQIMAVKGSVTRKEDQRAHIYEALQPAEKTKRQLAGDVLQRVFGGSASELMLHALAGRKSSRRELEELRHVLDEYERKLR